MASNLRTIQSAIKNTGEKDMSKYALFLGGLDVTNAALKQYDPLRTGYGRIFVVKKPKFIETLMGPSSTVAGTVEKAKYKSFFHMLEYGFTAIDGIQNTALEFDQLTGGYAGRSMDVPTLSRDETNGITLKVYEFAGSPIREMIDIWVTGISDPYTGLTHYYGADTPIAQENHTAEMIYVQTDPSGNSSGIEYACLLCNMMPKTVKKDHFNHESGSHPIVQYDIDFTATKYESHQINQVAKALVAKQTILKNYTYFQSGYDVTKTYNDAEAIDNSSWGSEAAARTTDPGLPTVLA